MEQRDSLKAELQNLTRLQGEQINILKDMSSKQTEQATLEQARQVHQQANFNTPSMYQYAAPIQSNPFGTTPMSSPYGNPYGATHGNFNLNGKFGMLDVLTPNSQMSLTSRTLASMDQGTKFTQAGVAAVGAGLSAGATWGLGAMLPGLAGMGLGMVGGVAAGAYVDMTSEQIKKNSALKKYLYKNSSMFIDPFESNNDRGVAGFSRKESEEAAKFVLTMNDEFYMSDDDTMMLLQKFTEGGLLKESKDLDTFKEKMQTLTKTVKEGALMLNETYDSIADLMAEMRAAGIDQKNFKDLMSSGSLLGSLLGADGSETLRDFLDWIKNFNAGTGNDNDKTYNRLENTSIYMSQWYDELKNADPKDLNFTDKQNLNMIENLGGAAEASKYTLALMEKMVEKEQFKNVGISFFDYDEARKEFKFNRDSFEDFISNNYSLQDMYNLSSKKQNELRESGNGNAITLWQNQYASYYKDSLEDGQMADFVKRVVDAYTNDPEMQANGYDYKGVLSLLGVTDAANQNLLSGFLQYKGDHPKLAQQVKLQDIWQQQTAQKLAETPSFTEQFKSGWEKIKDGMTGWAVNLDNALGGMVQGIQDWWTGYKPMPKYDSTFTTSSKIENITYDEVIRNTKQTNDILAAGFSSLKEMQEKGYTIDEQLYKFMEKKFEVSDKTVEYERDIITNWDDLSKGIRDSKDEITKIAEKNELSETIVAALFKYNQQKPKDEQLKITTTDDSFAQNLSNNVFNYGGNNQLALAASLSSSTIVDNALNRLGYNVENLRSVGAQENLINVNLDSLGLDEEIVNQVREILTQNLSSGITTTGEAVTPQSQQQVYTQDLGIKSNVTADDINAIIDKNTANKPNSMMKGMGETIIQASEQTGIDAMYLMAHAAWETGWGTSGILNDKYNWFGIGAYNASPGESAYRFNDKNDGFIAGAEWIKKNYYDAGQNTISGMISVPGHNYAVYDDGSPNIGWRDGISSIIMSGLNYVGKGYGETIIEEVGGAVQTTKQKVMKDQYGNTLTDEEVQKTQQERWAEEGFIDQTTSSEYKNMERFLKTMNTTELLRTESPEERNARIKDSLSSYMSSGAIKAEKDVGYSNGPITTNKDNVTTAVDKLIQKLDSALESDAYGDINDILKKDSGVQDAIDKVLSYFTDSKAGQEFVDGILSERKVVEKGLGEGLGRYEMLQEFGQMYLGIDKSGLMIDSAQYNASLEHGVTSFYQSGLAMLKGFLSGDAESAEYQAWAGKSAAEQEALLETLKKLEYALGTDGEKSEVAKVMEGKTQDDIHTEEDNYKKQFIHKNDDGKYYYDESKANDKATWDDYNTWIEQGQRRLNFGSVSKLLASENITTTDESGVELSIEDLIQKVTQNMNKVSEEQYKLINGQANDYLKELMTSRESIIGMSNSERQDLASGDENTIAQANNAYNKFLEQVGNMIKAGDAAGLRELRETEKENGRTFDDTAFDKFIDLAEKIKSMDASEFMKIIDGLNEIVAQSADVAKTVALFTGADGQGGIGEGFSAKFTEELMSSIKTVFEGTTFGDNVSSGKYDVAEILEIVKEGGVKDGEVILSPESLDKMALIMSDAMDKTFDERLKTTGGIEEFENSALFDAFKDGITIDLGGSQLSLEDAMQKLTEVAAQGTEASSEALAERDEVIEKVKIAFQEQVDDAGEVADDAAKKFEDAHGNTAKTVDDFVTAIEEYDSAIQSAVKTLSGSVTTISESVDGVEGKVERHLNWHNSNWNPANWFSGGSNGNSVQSDD